MKLTDMSAQELAAFKQDVQKEYEAYKALGLKLNMARGKPGAEQARAFYAHARLSYF